MSSAGYCDTPNSYSQLPSLPAAPQPFRKKGSDVYYCRLMIPKEGGGYRERTKSLGTSNLREARRRFPQAYASLQEEHKLIEPSPSQLRQKVQKAIDEMPLNSELDLDYFVRQITGKSVVDDPETGLALDPQQEMLREAIYKKDPLLVPPTWEELVEAWANRRKRNTGVAPAVRSIDALNRAIRELLYVDKSITPLSLQEEMVWTYIRHQQAKGVSDRTIASKVGMLRAMTKAAHVQRLVPSDPLALLEFKAAPTPGSGYRSPTHEEYKVIAHNIKTQIKRPDDALLLELLMFTGMRVDEAASRYGQHLRDGMISVSELKSPLPLWTAKTAGSYRQVPVPQSIQLPEVAPDQQLFPGCVYRPKDQAFSKAFSKRCLTPLFRGLEDAPPGLVIHSFRNGFIDACRAVETPVEIEQELVGHSGAQSAIHKSYGEGYGPPVLKKWLHKAEDHLLKITST